MRTLLHTILFAALLGPAAPFRTPETAPQDGKQRPAPFIVFATVFSDRGFTVQGAEARLRRASEKKCRWEAYSDRQGEFAMRVPPGEEYELTVSAKGFQTQTQKVDGRQTNRVDLTLHLVPASKENKAESKPGKTSPAPEKPSREK